MSSNCSLNIAPGVQRFQLASSIPTFILGVLGNVSVLIAFIRRPRRDWSYMNVYITNMAVADCVVLVLLPVRIASYLNTLENSNFWDQTNIELCYVLVSVHYVNMYVSIFTVTAISVARYIAIKYPLLARQVFSCRRALVVCALIWLINCSFSAVFHNVDKPETNTTIKCFQKNKEKELPLTFILVLNILGFLLPFLIMSFCSIRVVLKLRKQLDIGSRSEKIQCMLIMVANLAVFVICFLPVHLGFVFKYVTQVSGFSCEAQDRAHNFVHAAMSISSMNCALDCFSYYFAAKNSWASCCGAKKSNEELECHYNRVS